MRRGLSGGAEALGLEEHVAGKVGEGEYDSAAGGGDGTPRRVRLAGEARDLLDAEGGAG